MKSETGKEKRQVEVVETRERKNMRRGKKVWRQKNDASKTLKMERKKIKVMTRKI